MFGGAYVGESAQVYLAIYETDANGTVRLYGVGFEYIEEVAEDTTSVLMVDDIVKKDGCTYQAKVFMWQDMAGTVYPLA